MKLKRFKLCTLFSEFNFLYGVVTVVYKIFLAYMFGSSRNCINFLLSVGYLTHFCSDSNGDNLFFNNNQSSSVPFWLQAEQIQKLYPLFFSEDAFMQVILTLVYFCSSCVDRNYSWHYCYLESTKNSKLILEVHFDRI